MIINLIPIMTQNKSLEMLYHRTDVISGISTDSNDDQWIHRYTVIILFFSPPIVTTITLDGNCWYTHTTKALLLCYKHQTKQQINVDETQGNTLTFNIDHENIIWRELNWKSMAPKWRIFGITVLHQFLSIRIFFYYECDINRDRNQVPIIRTVFL